MRRQDFGTDFVWGAASASFQIEGAPTADGKRTVDLGRCGAARSRPGAGGDLGIDFYNRWNDDLELISSLGLRGQPHLAVVAPAHGRPAVIPGTRLGRRSTTGSSTAAWSWAWSPG